MNTQTKAKWSIRMRSYVPARFGVGDAIQIFEVLQGRRIVHRATHEAEAYAYFRSAKYADGQGAQDRRD